MKILVRLPNWLGDMVMSTGFLRALRIEYPSADIDIIVKKGLESLADFIPGMNRRYIFDKKEWKGTGGAFRFGKNIRKQTRYDLFFCLPDSFSSALMGRATGAGQRIGFKKELRSFLLTRSFSKPPSLHRVDEYVMLLQLFTNKKNLLPVVSLKSDHSIVPGRIIINFNSEAESRRMPQAKAVSLLNALIHEMPTAEFICIGSKKEKEFVEEILKQVDPRSAVSNAAGETADLSGLVHLISSGNVLLTTDSGPAHIGNALGIPTVVTFGAGNENKTAPYNKKSLSVLRLGQLPCEPCEKNTCQFGSPKCLEQLEINNILKAVDQYIVR